MVYRCERCGKPHARDDPPCTDCGYDSFKQYDEETSATVETGPNFVWACSDCGRQHVKHTPPAVAVAVRNWRRSNLPTNNSIATSNAGPGGNRLRGRTCR
ncbi:hypothetical protein ACFQH2_09765 [Natronoarchaeum sp. GCM10025703]|uniref:hypothetical protein n=1 Tax=Natronoarchaeum sp. GCM10025703 TaxID=3252685 RepID=UPI003612F07A